jgi:mevalonate kinase
MPAIRSTAPGKIILFGEHAVVYGRPAIAVPLMQVQAEAIITADLRAPSGRVRLLAPDIGVDAALKDLPETNPLGAALRGVLSELGIARPLACTVRVTSSIPRAAGLGSGAAVSVALIRAFAGFLGARLADERVSALAFEVEKLHHGTPSGIDNTVIAYAMPVYFVRGQPIERFVIPTSFTIVIGDTGVHSPTAVAVGDLRRAWQAAPAVYEPLFEAAGQIAMQARAAIESGQVDALGPLMNANQALLQQMGVSCVELDRLVETARQAGALGAKLSGAGRGGNMIALVQAEQAERIAAALTAAGAVRTILTQVY